MLSFPGARRTGEDHVNIEIQGYAIEISVGDGDVCTIIWFYVYGDGLAAAGVIKAIGERLGVRVWDINGCQFLDGAADPASGFKRYKEYRDKVLKDAGVDGAT